MSHSRRRRTASRDARGKRSTSGAFHSVLAVRPKRLMSHDLRSISQQRRLVPGKSGRERRSRGIGARETHPTSQESVGPWGARRRPRRATETNDVGCQCNIIQAPPLPHWRGCQHYSVASDSSEGPATRSGYLGTIFDTISRLWLGPRRKCESTDHANGNGGERRTCRCWQGSSGSGGGAPDSKSLCFLARAAPADDLAIHGASASGSALPQACHGDCHAGVGECSDQAERQAANEQH